MTGNVGELSFNPSYVNSGRAQEYASQMRNNPTVSNKYAKSKKEPLITGKELARLAFVVVGMIVLTLAIGTVAKASENAGYITDSHGNVTNQSQRGAYPEPGSEITSGRGH